MVFARRVLSKPALLKKGLRQVFCSKIFNSLHFLSKPALLKKGLRLIQFYLHPRSILNSRNLPYLKRDCDSLKISSSLLSFVLCSRNLPYLKRDCDFIFVLFYFCKQKKCRNLPYLKRDCDFNNRDNISLDTSIVETCPT